MLLAAKGPGAGGHVWWKDMEAERQVLTALLLSKATDLIMTQVFDEDIEFCPAALTSFVSLEHSSPFSMCRKYFPHDLVPSPNFPLYGETSFCLVLADQFSIQSAPFSIVGFLKFHIVYLLWLTSKQRNIFTISRNSIWAPASINFSTIAKCPSKHAL